MSIQNDNRKMTVFNRLAEIAMQVKKMIKPAVATIAIGIALAGVMNTVEVKAQEKVYKPELVFVQDYFKERLEDAYQYRYGKPWDPTDTVFFRNPDSVMIDISWEHYPESAIWTKRYITVGFDKNIIPRKETYEDNRMLYYTIEDILPQYEKTIEGFRKIEERYGKFKFVDVNTAYPDTTHYWIEGNEIHHRRGFWLEFENYVPALLQLHPTYNPRGYSGYKDYRDIGLGHIFEDISDIELVRSDVWMTDWFHGTVFNTSIPTKTKFIHLEIHPNVASDQITLYLPETLTVLPKIIQIMDATGTVVKLFSTGIDTQQILNISGLHSGRYFIQIDNYIGSFIVR